MKRTINTIWAKSFITAFCMLFMVQTSVFALPDINEIVSGGADVQVTDSTMQISVLNDTIINYNSFNILANEQVIFSLPSDSSQVLNRVIGSSYSQLLGTLTSNGLFILVNPNGIDIGSSAMINASNLILSTRDIVNADFIAKNYVFKKLSSGEDKVLRNRGTINISEGGFGVLIAGGIKNEGVIAAPVGKVALAAGDAVSLVMSADGLLSVAIDEKTASEILDFEGNPITDQIENTGTIEVDGGTVIIKASSVTDIFEKSVNLDGYVRAVHTEIKDGVVRIVADGDVNVTGEILAGDIIEILGDAISNYGTLNVAEGALSLIAQGAVTSLGTLVVDTLVERGASFLIGGTYNVGFASVKNDDHAVNLDTGDYSGVTSDDDDIIVNAAAVITLTGDTTFSADFNADGAGDFTMNAGSSIVGGSNDLTISANKVILTTSADSITTTGDITLKPSTTTQTVAIGGSATGGFNLDLSEMAVLTAGYNSLTIGASGNTGAVDINDVTFEGDTTIYGGAMVVETITTADFDLTLEATGDITEAVNDTTDNFALGSGNLTLDSSSSFLGTFASNLDVNTTGTMNLSATSAGYFNFKAATSTFGTVDLPGLLYFSPAGDVAQTGVITTDILFIISGGGNVDFSTQDNAITALFPITTAGDFLLNNGDNSLSLANVVGTAGANGNIVIDVGTGLLSTGGNPINAGSGDITLIADTINLGTLADKITTTGDIILKPTTTSQTVGIGDDATGDFDLDVAEIAALAAGYNSLTIGADGNTGAVDIEDITFEGATTIYGGETTLDTITTDNLAVTLDLTGGVIDEDYDTGDNFALGSGALTITTTTGDIGGSWPGNAAYVDVDTTGQQNYTASAGSIYINSKNAATDIGTVNAGSTALKAFNLSAAGDISQSGAITAPWLWINAAGMIDFSTQDNTITNLTGGSIGGDFLLNNGNNSLTFFLKSMGIA